MLAFVGNPDSTHSVVSNCCHLSCTSCPVLVVPVVLERQFFKSFLLFSAIPGAWDPGRCHWCQSRQRDRSSAPGLGGCAGYLVGKLLAGVALKLSCIPSSRIDTTTPFPAQSKGQNISYHNGSKFNLNPTPNFKVISDFVTCVASCPGWFHIHVRPVSSSSIQKPLLPEILRTQSSKLSDMFQVTWTWGHWKKMQSCFVVSSFDFPLSSPLSFPQRSHPRYRPPARHQIQTEKSRGLFQRWYMS